MTMPFKIRKHYQSRERYEIAERNYSIHLGGYASQAETDLFKYFGWDFFHDGLISSIKFSRDLATVELVIGAPNIRIPDPKLGYNFASELDYVCRFSGVANFSIENKNALVGPVQRDAKPRYLYAEINTGIPRRVSKAKPTFSALRIMALGSNEHVWVELFFTGLIVTPKDQIAFSNLREIPGVQFNLYAPRA